MEYYFWLCFSLVGGIIAIGFIPIIWLIGRGHLNRVPAMTKIYHDGYQPGPVAGLIKPPPKKP